MSNNPLSFIDPDGRYDIPVVIICGNCGDDEWYDTWDEDVWDLNDLRNQLDALRRAEDSDARYNFLREKMERMLVRKQEKEEVLENMSEMRGLKLVSEFAEGHNNAPNTGDYSHSVNMDELMASKGFQTGPPGFSWSKHIEEIVERIIGIGSEVSELDDDTYEPSVTPNNINSDNDLIGADLILPDSIVTGYISRNGDTSYYIKSTENSGARLSYDPKDTLNRPYKMRGFFKSDY